MTAVVGIPCGLFYYKYKTLWKAFFDLLGVKTVLSGPTGRKIMEAGIECCLNEACLPVKTYFGHAVSLTGKADYLFIPRYTSIHKREYICPKFGGLPDMVRSNLKGLPKIIDTEINLHDKGSDIRNTIYEIAEEFGIGRSSAMRAYEHALYGYHTERDSLAKAHKDAKIGDSIAVLVMGHEYIVYDKYLNMNMEEKLAKLGCSMLTMDMYDARQLRARTSLLPKPVFWSYGTKALGCAYYLMECGGVDGIIYIGSFGCGIDSFVEYMIERRVRKGSDIPFMNITIDEHTGEAGLDTRLEAFIDTIRWRHRAC